MADPDPDEDLAGAIDDMIEPFRPLFTLIGVEWLLRAEEVRALILETDADLAWLAHELNDHADQIVRRWQSEGGGLGGSDCWGTRRFVHALKTAAMVLQRSA